MQASSSAAAANAEELAELNRKLKSSEDELDRLNKRFNEVQGKSELNCLLQPFGNEVFRSWPKQDATDTIVVVAMEVENLKAELRRAR